MSLGLFVAENDGFAGELALAGPEAVRELLRAADDDGYLSVALATPGPGRRGELALLIADAIESALEVRGACAPGIGAATDLGSSLSDQLYRARLVELRGLALALPSLEGIANLAGALDAEDSAVLRWWMAATRERPVRLYLDAKNRHAGVYDRPVALQELLERGPRERAPKPPALSPEVNASSEAMELSAPPPAVSPSESFVSALTTPESMTPESMTPESMTPESMTPESMTPESMPPESMPPESMPPESMPPESRPPEPRRAGHDAPATSEPPEAAAAQAFAPDSSEAVEAALAASAVPTDAGGEDDASHSNARGTAATSLAAAGDTADASRVDVAAVVAWPPLFPNAESEWRTWLHDLEAARGPKPLAVVERMFVTSYVPLWDAVARGLAPAEARRALEAWSTSFEQSYKEAFDALRVRGKRPTMVLDVPDLAQRIARLHGARSVQLVLVDGLRFDLGLRLEQRLRRALGSSAALTERLLLWSALPATTAVQLDLIGRGAEALREFTGEVESDVPVARGRMASTLRRIKAGHRELLKLDVVESRVSEPDERDEPARLDELADDAGQAVADYMGRLPARTLVMVFGDHGFVLDTLGRGTSRARKGGAAPEEVLVPAYAWLVGGVH